MQNRVSLISKAPFLAAACFAILFAHFGALAGSQMTTSPAESICDWLIERGAIVDTTNDFDFEIGRQWKPMINTTIRIAGDCLNQASVKLTIRQSYFMDFNNFDTISHEIAFSNDNIIASTQSRRSLLANLVGKEFSHKIQQTLIGDDLLNLSKEGFTVSTDTTDGQLTTESRTIDPHVPSAAKVLLIDLDGTFLFELITTENNTLDIILENGYESLTYPSNTCMRLCK